MHVNKYTINLNQLGTTGATILVPLTSYDTTIDQAEIVETDFVNIEIENAINPISDFEKARFTPVDNVDVQLNKLQYNVKLLNNGSIPLISTYDHAGFTYNDLRYGKNRFKRSFLRLSFYDTDIPTNQNLVSFITLFCKLDSSDIVNNIPKPVNVIPIRFITQDPISNPEGFAEGYYLYHFKETVDIGLPTELFMRATWNNAKSGESIPLTTSAIPVSIDELVDHLHVRYILKRDTTGYYYQIDPSYSSPSNVATANGFQIINLYQIQVL